MSRMESYIGIQALEVRDSNKQWIQCSWMQLEPWEGQSIVVAGEQQPAACEENEGLTAQVLCVGGGSCR